MARLMPLFAASLLALARPASPQQPAPTPTALPTDLTGGLGTPRAGGG
eukprot:COSAG04_NODE_12632_length_643_cov_0.437500_2_plen_47_part_01